MPVVVTMLTMPVTVRSFAKINLGLCIVAKRPDGFHDLRTVYLRIGLNDVSRRQMVRGWSTSIRSTHTTVSCGESRHCSPRLAREMQASGPKAALIPAIA